MLVGLVAAGLDVLLFFVGWCIIVRVFNKTIKFLIFVLNVFLLWQFVCAHPTLCFYQPPYFFINTFFLCSMYVFFEYVTKIETREVYSFVALKTRITTNRL